MTLKEYTPKWRWVVVEKIDVTKTTGGIFLPTGLEPTCPVARVLAVGGECIDTTIDNLVVLEGLELAKVLDFTDTGNRKIYAIREQQIMGEFTPIPKKKKK